MSLVHEGARWKIERFISGFSNNAYLVTAKADGSSVIIDTPDEPHELIAAARRTTVRGVLITHNHWDHLEGFEDVLNAFRVPVGIGDLDAPAIEGKTTGGAIDVSDGNVVDIYGIVLTAIFTPGHTDGSTCLRPGRPRRPGRRSTPVLGRHPVSGWAGQVEEPRGIRAVGGVDHVEAVPVG